MAERDYSKFQQKVIKRYYDNREQVDEQRLAELTTEIYLASGKKLDKLWTTAEEILRRMKVMPSRIEHILTTKDPTILAEVVKDVQSGTLRRDHSGDKPAS